jgi:hypothetical protein
MPTAAFGVVPRAVLLDQQLGHAALRLYALLATYADERFEAHPTTDQLRADMGLSDVRNIRALLSQLEAGGHLERTPRFGANGVQMGSTYRLLIPVGRQVEIPGQKYSNVGG